MQYLQALYLLSCLFSVLPPTVAQSANPVPRQQEQAPTLPPPPGYDSNEWEKVKKFQLQQTDDAANVSRDSPAAPINSPAEEELCNQPTLNDTTAVQNSFYTPRWSKPQTISVGSGNKAKTMFDMTKDSCIPKSYDLYVRNRTKLEINIWQDPAATCTALATYADNPVKDYGSVFTALLTPATLGAIHTIDEKVQLDGTPVLPITTITLPWEKIKNTVATVTISCHADKKDTKIGVQQKFIVHYGSVDFFSGSAGAIVSPLGKKIYGVNIADTGNKNTDGTPITNSIIGVTASSNAQFVPMGFVDFNWAGNEQNNLNLQVGIGINPNGSSTQVEYFLSPLAFSTHHIYFAPGVHIAQSQRITGGFYTGETVGSSFSVPTSWKTTYKLGFTISVKPYK